MAIDWCKNQKFPKDSNMKWRGCSIQNPLVFHKPDHSYKGLWGWVSSYQILTLTLFVPCLFSKIGCPCLGCFWKNINKHFLRPYPSKQLKFIMKNRSDLRQNGCCLSTYNLEWIPLKGKSLTPTIADDARSYIRTENSNLQYLFAVLYISPVQED